MTTSPLTSLIAKSLLLLAVLLTLVLLASPPAQIEAVLRAETQACPAQCRAAVPTLQALGGRFQAWRTDLAAALSSDTGFSEDYAAWQARARRGMWSIASERLACLEGLVRLLVIRLYALASSLAILLVFIAAVVLDAAVARRIAHQDFEAARPAVSFVSALGVVACIGLGAALMTVPVAGAGTAGFVVLSVGALGLHGWVRYFHML